MMPKAVVLSACTANINIIIPLSHLPIPFGASKFEKLGSKVDVVETWNI